MSHPKFENDPAYQEFLTWVETNCQPGTIDPTSSQAARFLPASILEAHFKDRNYYHLSKLLLAIFQEDEVPVDAYHIAEKCSKVFCTLLVIGKPQYIRQFAQSEELQDSRLPFSPIYHHPDFPRCTSDADSSEFLRRFCEMQWMVCAPNLDFQVHRKLQDDRILPFTVKKKLGGGGSAILHEIEIYPTYNLLSTLNGAPQISNDRFANTFALKTYVGDNAERYYNCEVSAFRRLRLKTENMIGFHGSFKQRNRYHILLEFADQGTLEQYFKTTSPPTSGEDIIKFWERMFMLIEALMCIHGGELEFDPGSAQPLQGWHQDIKPANILVSTLGETIKYPYDYRFKLGDLGTSHFKKQVSPHEDNIDQDSRGTGTYGAPECCRTDDTLRRSRINVTQKVDVWSLGGVLSEAAVWLVENYQRLQHYRQDRRRATKNIAGLQDSDCFHDGENVLEIVHFWHKSLKGCLRRDDLLTEEVLRMIDLMLHEETTRIPTKTVWAMSKRILEDAKRELRARGLGIEHANPTISRPPPSISSQSMSLAPSRHGDINSQFDNVARAASPLLYTPEIQDSVGTESRLFQMGLNRNRSTPATSRYVQPNQQRPTRFNTVHESTNNLSFNDTTRPRPQSHDDPPTQPLHQFTQTIGGLNTQEEDELSHPQDWAQSGTHNFVSMPSIPTGPSGNSFYPPLHREASEPVRGNLRHVPDGSPHNLHPQSSFRFGHNISGHVFQEPLTANQPHAWPQENLSLPQADFPSIQYATYNPNDDQDISHWNYSPNVQERPGASPPPPLQQMPMHSYSNNLHQNSPGAVVEDPRLFGNVTPHPQHGSFRPLGGTLKLPEASKSFNSKAKHKPPAVLYLGTAMSWLQSGGKVEELVGYDLFPRLKQRDHIFVVDDVLSMLTHWDDVQAVFGVLAKIVKSADPDGIDLHFLASDAAYNSKRLWGGNSSSKLLNHVKRQRQKVRGTSNITYRLDSILGPYITSLTNAFSLRKGVSVRPLNLYVLTDGIWEPGCDPSSTIKRLVDKLGEFGYPKDSKHIGIQFISFGTDRDALKKLQDLDDNLGQEMDIVDVTPFTGNIWKMLLGAIDKTFDES